jgi:large subunit ribosomal protein L3e
MAYKAGMTHVLREVIRPGSKLDKKEAVEAVTILEAPPMTVVGIVGYTETPKGLHTLATVWASHLDSQVLRRFYKNWHHSKGKAFTKYFARYYNKAPNGKEARQAVPINPKKGTLEDQLARITAHAQVVRVIAHTNIARLNLRQKKAHMLEIQVGRRAGGRGAGGGGAGSAASRPPAPVPGH